MRVALLCLLIGCGDNLTRPTYDSDFDGSDELLVFGDLKLFPGMFQQLDPMPGVEVCIEDICDTTADHDASFVLRVPDALGETIVEFRMDTPTIVPVVSGTLHERNLGNTVTIKPDALASGAATFGEELALDRAGMVLVVAQHDSVDPISFSIDGLTAHYFDDSAQPDPARTQIGARGSVAWYGVPPGEITIRTTAGFCSRQEDGWPGAEAGEIRAPVVAGSMTEVRPICR